jgi:hypothetical protein
MGRRAVCSARGTGLSASDSARVQSEFERLSAAHNSKKQNNEPTSAPGSAAPVLDPLQQSSSVAADQCAAPSAVCVSPLSPNFPVPL